MKSKLITRKARYVGPSSILTITYQYEWHTTPLCQQSRMEAVSQARPFLHFSAHRDMSDKAIWLARHRMESVPQSDVDDLQFSLASQTYLVWTPYPSDRGRGPDYRLGQNLWSIISAKIARYGIDNTKAMSHTQRERHARFQFELQNG